MDIPVVSNLNDKIDGLNVVSNSPNTRMEIKEEIKGKENLLLGGAGVKTNKPNGNIGIVNSNRITKTEAQQSMLNRKQKKLVHRLNGAYCRTGKMERILPILTGKSRISLRLIDWFVTNYSKIFNTHYSLNEYKLKRETRIKKGKTHITRTHKKDKIKERAIEKDKEKEKDKDNKSEISLSSSPQENNNVLIDKEKDGDNISKIENKDEYFNDLFFVYPSYRQELKTNSKKRFDVFCRNGSFNYYYDDYKFIETNDGQLNFFDWADNMYVIDYIEENYEEIEKDMELRNSKKPRSLKKNITAKAKKAITIGCEKDLETSSQKQRRKRREISESSLKTIHHIPHRAIISFS
jgi:hypothetical protein